VETRGKTFSNKVKKQQKGKSRREKPAQITLHEKTITNSRSMARNKRKRTGNVPTLGKKRERLIPPRKEKRNHFRTQPRPRGRTECWGGGRETVLRKAKKGRGKKKKKGTGKGLTGCIDEKLGKQPLKHKNSGT